MNRFVGYCDEHGEFHFDGLANGYCPVVCERWGRPDWVCGHRARDAQPFTLEFVLHGLREAVVGLHEEREEEI